MKLSPKADEIAGLFKLYWNTHCDWAELRDAVNDVTGGHFSTFWLDRLTDMVKRRLPNR